MGPCDGSSMRALLETLEDPSASPGVLTDAWLTLTNRLTEEEEDEDEGKEFAAEVENSFPQLYKIFMVPNIIAMLETLLHKGDSHSMVLEYEALNVIIRLIEQAPSDMEEQAVTWAKMIIPLLVHSAHKVQLRAASALEMGLPLLQQNQEVIAVAEQLLTTTLHHSGSFINSLLHLEELGFRSGSPVVKKIAFIAWKSLIDNFALNPEPLQCPVINSPSFFCKYASVFINAARDGFIAIGRDVSGNKRERQNSEVLTMLLQTLKNIILSKELPVLNSLPLLEVAIKELPPKVLGSPAYQIADMDLLNGTPALFLIQLLFCEDLLKYGIENRRFFSNYETLVECALSGPTSPLAFTESVLTIVSQNAMHLENKEYLWRMWSIMVNPLTEWIKQLAMKTLLRSWSELYKAFARCALLVATADDNICCEELCAKIISGLKDEAHLTENSQWGANISGIKVNPNGKRDSFLAQTGEPEEESIDFHITPNKMKLEFSRSKSNIKNIPLEEENTVDFVYIPVETKERVLTEHQKEVLRTKRDDIPVMYNNLDMSQDAVLFSQDTQNQEDSLEKPTIVDIKEEQGIEEDKLTPQKKEATSHQLVIPHAVTGNYKSNKTLEKITSTVTEQPNNFQKEKLDQKNEELNVCVAVQSPILDSTLNENPPNCSSNSSGSSDIVSPTPQVVVNRRQAFVTLEKFDDLENRPFSPSVFSNISITLTSPFIQKESTVATDVSSKEKSNLENKDGVKLKARKTVAGTKRTRLEFLNALEMCVKSKRTKEENIPDPKLQSTTMVELKTSNLRKNKTSDDKTSEQMQSDQEEKNQVSDTLCEDKQELSVDTEIAEHLLDDQSQIPSMADSTTMESKVLDIVKNENVGPNVEHKENTSPEIEVCLEAVSDVNQSPDISLNQKTLRRSLRRKAETDGAVDSQDKENSQQKYKQKDDEKIPPKKMAQNRETSGQKEKAEKFEKAADAPICVPVNNATENINSKENNQEQLDMSLGKSECSPAASDLEEPGPAASVEKLKVFPRYHTRRAASQGLLTSMENSESDISETREEGAKRKRSGKLKKNDSPGNQAKEEPDSQGLSSQAAVEIQTKSVGKQKISSGGETEVPLMSTNTKQEKGTSPLSPSVNLKENAGPTRPRVSSDTGRKPANRRESTSEPILENRQETSTLNTSVVPNNSNGVSKEDASATAVSAFPSPKRFLDVSECQHKRSKRTRKSRSCECCDEKLSPQVEKVSPEPKKASTPEPKLKEPRKSLNKVTVALALIPVAEEIHLAERLSIEPCATSTPLPFVKDAADRKEASNVAESVSGVPRNITPNVEPEKLACVQNESDKPVAGILDVPFSETISESRSMDSHSEELSAQGQPLEPGSVDSHSEEVSAKDQGLEPGSVDSHSEQVSAEDQGLEPGSVDSHPEEVIAKDQGLEPGSVDSHSEQVSAEDQGLEPGSVDSHPEEVIAKDQGLEPGSVDSHSEQVSAEDQGLEPGSVDSHSEEVITKDQGLELDSEDSHSEEVSAKDQGLEPDTEAETGLEAGNNQNGQLESETETEIKIIQVVGAQPEEGVIQNIVEEITVTSATEVAELQENETSEEEGAEDNAASAPSEHPTLVLWQEKNSTLDSPPKCKELDFLSLAKVSGSPTGTQARCLWSPSASPSISILKRAIKREPEEDSSSPANKNRRVSFANPIYQEELADDIDRRSPVLRIHPCNNGSQSLRSAKSSPNHQAKLITTPTKGSLSPGTRSHKYKTSKKCLITEMGTEPTPVPTESIYPALMGCKASVDIILPQITSNTWTRGLGHLIRAKNIRTVGDLSSLTAAEIKTLPIRSPRVLNLRKVLKGYHEQQVKSRGMEENAGLDDTEKSINVMDETFFSTNENADVCETEVSSTGESSAIDLWAQVNLLADQITSERLRNYSGNELFEMQEKLHTITDCIMKTLKSRWMLSRSCETTV
ncbi:Telomere-associated protein RIF1, partial [Ophiophagus hannah]